MYYMVGVAGTEISNQFPDINVTQVTTGGSTADAIPERAHHHIGAPRRSASRRQRPRRFRIRASTSRISSTRRRDANDR